MEHHAAKLCLLLCVALCCTQADDVEYIHLTGLFPLSEDVPQGSIGRGVLPAVELALQHLRESDTVLRGYELQITNNDTLCDMATGMKAFFESLAAGPPKYMVFGGACQVVTEPIAEAVHFWKIVQLSYAATTPALSKRQKYPYFFRTVPSEMDIGAARLRLFMYFNWTTISTIHQDIPRLFYAQSQQVKMMEDNGINILSEAIFADDPAPAISKLKEDKARIIVGFFDEEMARKVICKAFKEGMYGKTHVWLLPGWYNTTWWRSGDESDGCSASELQLALQGYISTDLLPLSGSDEPTISGYTPQEYDMLYNQNRGHEYSVFHGYAYDGVWVMARAIDSVLRSLRARGDLARFQNFNYSDAGLLEMFSGAMNETNFRGVTGIVQFREGERLGSTVHKQFQSNALMKVAEYYAITDSLNLSSGRGFEWPGQGGGDIPPRDTQITEIEPLNVSFALFGSMSAVAITGTIMAFGFLFFNMRYREERYIKMSSPFLNNLIIMGGILTYVSVVLLGIDHGIINNEHTYTAICTSRAWFLCLGFTLAFGAMFTKTWRVHRIFTNIKMKKKVIKDSQLIAIVGLMAVIDLIILVVWQIVDPMKPTEVKLSSRMDTTGRDVMIVPVMETCVSANMTIWLAVMYIYKGVLMIFGLFLAWETRHVSIPALNDSKYIGSSVYNVVIMCVLGVALSSVITDNPNASYGLVSVFILFCSTVTLCLVFVPKVIEMRSNPNVNDRVRVIGTMDKTRTASTSIHTFDTDQKFRVLCTEKRELKSKLDEQNEKIKELEKQLLAIAPDEVPLLLQEEERRSSGIDTPNSTCHSTKSRGTETSKVCASPGSVRFCVTEPTSSDQSQKNSTPSKSRWESQEFDDDAGDKSRLCPVAFGGVYIGPPAIPFKSSTTPPARQTIPSSHSAPISVNNNHTVTPEPVSRSNNSSLERIAQVHRPFSDSSSDDVTQAGDVVDSDDHTNNNSPTELGNNCSFKIAASEETSFVSLTRNLLD